MAVDEGGIDKAADEAADEEGRTATKGVKRKHGCDNGTRGRSRGEEQETHMDTIALLKKMMEFRSVSSDVKAVNKLVDFLAGYLAGLGLYTRLEKLNGRKVLYAAARRARRTEILMNAHLDVVPAEPGTYGAKERRGWIYGRGSSDCLGNCAVLAHVLRDCAGEASVGAIFSTDEEIGGHTTRHMVGKGYTGRSVIVADAGGNHVASAQKGILHARLTARGKACHGSTPWHGTNAIDKLIDGYLRVRKLFPAVKEGDEWHPTLSANVVKAGTVVNRVPDRAEMLLDIRYTEVTSRAELLRRIRAAASGLTVHARVGAPVVFCDEKHPMIKALVATMEKKLKRKIPFFRLNGATDARHFAKLEAPIAMIGVPGRGAHSEHEAVSMRGIRLYEQLLVSFCREHARGE